VAAPVAAPITSPLGAASLAGASSTPPISLAGIDTKSIVAEYNRFAENERTSALSQVGVAAVSVPAAEMEVCNAPQFANLAQSVGGAGNLHGIIRFLKTKVGNPGDFQKAALGLFGEVLGGALNQSPNTALNQFAPVIDALIRQLIPGLSLISPPGGGGTLFGPGAPGSSPNNPIYFKQISSDGGNVGEQVSPPPPPPRTVTPSVLDFIKSKVKDLQIATDGTMTGVTNDGKRFQIPVGGLVRMLDN
jgi:hypothetical protein